MPFTSETARKYGGRKPGAGRKPKAVVEAEKTARQLVRDCLEKNAEELAGHYMRRAFGKNADRVLCHAIDKILPDEQVNIPPAITINFVRFDNTVQLHAAPVSSPVLAGNGRGHQAGDQGLASSERQGQDGLKFLDFKDVP